MEKRIKAYDLNDSLQLLEVKVDFPRKCPICNVAVNARLLNAYFYDCRFNEKSIFAVFFCPSCEMVFIGYYKQSQYDTVSLISFEPRQETEERDFPQNIESLSPEFCKIYNQAFAAEQGNLNDICGMAYRKALEFLIKDYAILLNPEKSDEIKGKLLSKCIEDHIDDRRIKKLAKASAWIGNDETHYVRKHEDYNTNDLKMFIDATVSFIDYDLTSMRAEDLIDGNR